MQGNYQALKALDAAHTSNMTPRDAAIALNAPTTYTGAAPFQASDLLSRVSQPSLYRMLNLPAFDATIRPLLDQSDPKSADTLRRLGQWLQAIAAAGICTVPEAQTIGELLANTASYSDGPSLAVSCAGWGLPVTADDVIAARSLT